MKGKYQFLFFYQDSERDKGEVKYYTATSIKTACRKFHNWRKNTTNERKFDCLDYEVAYNGEFIDISNIECVKEYLN